MMSIMKQLNLLIWLRDNLNSWPDAALPAQLKELSRSRRFICSWYTFSSAYAYIGPDHLQ